MLIFTCRHFEAVHLEQTRTQTDEEFQRQQAKLFLSRKTIPERIILNNDAIFKAQWGATGDCRVGTLRTNVLKAYQRNQENTVQNAFEMKKTSNWRQ